MRCRPMAEARGSGAKPTLQGGLQGCGVKAEDTVDGCQGQQLPSGSRLLASGGSAMATPWMIRLLAAVLIAATALLPAAGGAAHASGGIRVKPARKDLCAHAGGGTVPETARYSWFCSGVQTVKAHRSAAFDTQCGAVGGDPRKLFGYWVSAPGLTLVKVTWFDVGDLQLTFRNVTGRTQRFEFWISCTAS